jgi:hypothetical protein
VSRECCLQCRLRFSLAAAACLPACPECGAPLQPLDGLERAVGLRLFSLDDRPDLLPQAVAVALPIPTLRPGGQVAKAEARRRPGSA